MQDFSLEKMGAAALAISRDVLRSCQKRATARRSLSRTRPRAVAYASQEQRLAGFEWNPAKAAENERKHRVGFAEAVTVFDDPDALVSDDESHSNREERLLAIGRSAGHRLLTVSYTMRGDSTRIISVRVATPAEADEYERNAGT